MTTLRLNRLAITLNGVPVFLNGPDARIRLEFAAITPRQGEVLGMNPRRGRPMNVALRQGTILTASRRS